MADRITRWLDDSQRLADQATDGPWEVYGFNVLAYLGAGDCSGCSGTLSPAHLPECGLYEVAGAGKLDAEFIAGARTRFPQAVAALREIAKLHQPNWPSRSDDGTPCKECNRSDCTGLNPTWWPCPTLRAIINALGLEGDDDEHLG